MNATPSSNRDAPGVDLAQQSIAGEEDPGASIDLAVRAAGAPIPAGQAPAPMAPGDQAPPGTPGTGEDVCPRCGGSGKVGQGDCPDCQGTGRIVAGIGGG